MPDFRLGPAGAGKSPRSPYPALPAGPDSPANTGSSSKGKGTASPYMSPTQRVPQSPSGSFASTGLAATSPFLPPAQLAPPDISRLSPADAKLWDSLPQFVAPAVPGVVHPYYGLVDGRLNPNLVKHLRGISKGGGTASQAPAVSVSASVAAGRSPAANGTLPLLKTTDNEDVEGLRKPSKLGSASASVRLSPMAEDAQVQLRRASENGDLGTVRRLLKQFREGKLWELSVNQPVETTGMTALHYAAARGHAGVVRELCEEGGAVVDLPDLEGETPLMKAAYGGHLEVVKWLVANEADVRRGDRDGWTPLHNAAGRGHLGVVQYLVSEAGAPVDAKSHQGHTPLMNAASTGHAPIVRCLLDTKRSQPFWYNEFSECAYDVAAIGLHARVCDILETAEREIWAGIAGLDQTVPPYNPISVHTTQLVSLYENQRARPRPQRSTASAVGAALAHRLSFFSRGRSNSSGSAPALSPGAADPSSASSVLHDADFSPANLVETDPAQMTDGDMVPRRLRDMLLPRTSQGGMDWFWLSDWTSFVDAKPEADSETGALVQITDANGWQYSAHGFNSPDTTWTAYVLPGARECVRRRRWVRAMKRQVPLDDPTAVFASNPVLSKINRLSSAGRGNGSLGNSGAPRQAAQPDYLETARTILDSIRDADDADLADVRQLELQQARHAVSVLLSNIATDEDEERKLAARKLADDALKRAECLASGLQSDTQDALMQALNESENALGITAAHAATPTLLDKLDPSGQGSAVSLVADPIGSSSEDAQSFKTTDERMQMYLKQAEEELGAAGVSPVEPVARDEVVEEDDDERLFAKTVRKVKASKTAREDSMPDIAKVVTTEAGQGVEGSDAHTSRRVADQTRGCGSASANSSSSEAALSPLSGGAVGDEEPEAESGGEEAAGEPSADQAMYPRSSLFMRQCLPESAWEPDEATAVCRQCARRFTLFLRRHHCRRCGLVFCDSCSSNRTLLASPISPAQSGYYGSPLSPDSRMADVHEQQLYGGPSNAMHWRFREHRACDPCALAVGVLPTATADSVAALPEDCSASGTVDNAYNIFRDADADGSLLAGAGLQDHQRHNSDGANPYAAHRRRTSTSSIRVCPVCDKDWATVWHLMNRMPGEGWQEAQERHIRECIEDTSAEMQGTHGRQRGDPRRSRSVQSRRGSTSAATRGGSTQSASQPRRSVGGFLSFFDRISPPDSEVNGDGGNGGTDRAALAIGTSSGRAASPAGDADESHSAHLPRSARSPMGVKYIAYKLNGDTPLLGQECAICFEDFEPGQRVARLNCLCTYHLECINEWLQRTPACPVHYE